jgi:uncharacterized protein DUF6789
MLQDDLRAGIDGAIGGAVGTLVMSVFMLLARAVGLIAPGQLPPERITAGALDAAGVRKRKEETQDALSVVSHFGFGSSAGALFALLHRHLRQPLPSPLQGTIFGGVLWLANYAGWVPALGLMPPPQRDQPPRPPVMILGHIMYGLTLGMVVGRRSKQQAT